MIFDRIISNITYINGIFFLESFDRDEFNTFDDRLHLTQKILISNFKFQ